MSIRNQFGTALPIGFVLASIPGLWQGLLAQSNATYTYDALGRLTNIDYPATVGNVSGTKSIAFSYDPAGNRTAVAIAETPALGNSPPVAAPDNYVAVPQVPTEMNVLWNDREPNQRA